MNDWIIEGARLALSRAEPRLRARFGDRDKRWTRFKDRLDTEAGRIFELAHSLYGWRWDFSWHLEEILVTAASASAERPGWLSKRDRTAGDAWLTAPSSLWAQCYIDRFAGDFSGLSRSISYLNELGVTHLHVMPPYRTPPTQSDGGYAVSDYRKTHPDLGSIGDFRSTVRTMSSRGVGVVLDFVANHTADDHAWARAAKSGDARYRNFYLMFEDRFEPDRYSGRLREIFPGRGGDAFTWRQDVAGPSGGAWVWTTFHEYQWDLDYRNPEVFAAMAGEILFLANLGASVIRMDATPFLWKRQGTTCENLPEAHLLLQLFNALMAVVAPSVRLLSEAIVHPDEVAKFITPGECHLGYNPVVMSTMWEALATQDTRLLQASLARQGARTPGCQWITYLRSHDDIGWGFADEDAQRLGIDPVDHRAFLNSFFDASFPGSFASGARFQDNPLTGDARISGTLGALAGLESALANSDEDAIRLAVGRILMLNAVMLTSVGIPLIYLGDEIAQLNHERFRGAVDNRWMHRGPFDRDQLERARAGNGPEGAIWAGMQRLLAFRRGCSALADSTPELVGIGMNAVLSYRRSSADSTLWVIANFSEETLDVALDLAGEWADAWSGGVGNAGLLEPYGFRLLVQNAKDS